MHAHTSASAEANGDKELEVSPWQEVNQGVGATRSVRFVAPLEVRVRACVAVVLCMLPINM